MHHEYNYHYCKQCHRAFTWDNSHPTIFCSVDCFHKWKAEHKKPVRPSQTYERICEWCGKTFTTRISGQKYCCHDCGHEADKQKLREADKALHISKTYTCKNCGVEFTPEYADKHRVFCSNACARRYKKKEKRKSEKGKAGRRKYNTIREKFVSQKNDVVIQCVKERDNGICQICGLPVINNDSDWCGIVNHIIPLSQGGNHTMENCQLTHNLCSALKAQTPGKYSINWEEKATPNSHWFSKYKRLKDNLKI